MRPDKRCASHVSLSPRVTAPVGKARCGEGEGQDMCGWNYVGGCLEQRRHRCLAALSRSPDCLASVICSVCTTNAGHVSPLKFVASRLCLFATLLRILSFFCTASGNNILHFLQVFFCFCPETQMDIAICVIRAVPPSRVTSTPFACRLRNKRAPVSRCDALVCIRSFVFVMFFPPLLRIRGEYEA